MEAYEDQYLQEIMSEFISGAVDSPLARHQGRGKRKPKLAAV